MDDTDTPHVSLYGVAQPQPLKQKNLKRLLSWPLDVAQEFLTLLATFLFMVFLFTPLVLALVASGIAGLSGIVTIVQMLQAYKDGQYLAMLNAVPALEWAVKVVFVGLLYLALFSALQVMMAGIVGRRWQRFYLLPGLLLVLPLLLAFTIAVYILVQDLTSFTTWPQLPLLVFAGYACFVAVLLSLLLTDLRPPQQQVGRITRLRQWLRARPGRSQAQQAKTAEAARQPLLRFGPTESVEPIESVELAEAIAPAEPAQPTTATATEAHEAPVNEAMNEAVPLTQMEPALEEVAITTDAESETEASAGIAGIAREATEDGLSIESEVAEGTDVATTPSSMPEVESSTAPEPMAALGQQNMPKEEEAEVLEEREEHEEPAGIVTIGDVRGVVDVSSVGDRSGVRDVSTIGNARQSMIPMTPARPKAAGKGGRRNRAKGGAQLVHPATSTTPATSADASTTAPEAPELPDVRRADAAQAPNAAESEASLTTTEEQVLETPEAHEAQTVDTSA